MKRFILVCCAALTALCCTACAGSGGGTESGTESSQQTEKKTEGLNVVSSEAMDPVYTELLRTYFEAISHKDYEAYKKVIYPPYLESYGKYLESNGTNTEKFFYEDLCTRFDEDGYESWKLTELQIEYYPEERQDPDGFFAAYAKAGIIDDGFGARCQKDASELRDVAFTLYALYEGDEEAVPVVTNQEIYVMKNADGAFLFG